MADSGHYVPHTIEENSGVRSDLLGHPPAPANLRHSIALRWAREEKLTIRQLYERYAGARGRRTIIGSPMQIAEHMTEWFLTYGVDGFLIQPPYLRGGLDDFVDQVIPELQEHGLFRTE